MAPITPPPSPGWRRLKQASFRDAGKTLDTFDFDFNKQLIIDDTAGEWFRRGSALGRGRDGADEGENQARRDHPERAASRISRTFRARVPAVKGF